MNAARAGCRKADAEFAGVFRVGTRHESGRFFVAYLDKSDLVRALSKSFHNPVDPIPRQPKHHIDAPIMNSVNQHIRRRGFHARFLLPSWTSGVGICHVNSIRSPQNGEGVAKWSV